MTGRFPFVLTSAALFLSACEPRGVAIEDIERPIVGGQVSADGQFPAVGALAIDDPQFGLFTFCTGTLISPTVVLTAAHCISAEELSTAFGVQLSQSDVTQLVRVVFDAVQVPGDPGLVTRAADTRFNTAFNINNLGAGNDIGVVILSEPVQGIAPIPFLRTDAAALIGNTFTAVGYGVTDFNSFDSGVQRFVDLTLVDVFGQLTFYGELNANVCSGDSGGPDLMDIAGDPTVIGVHSFVQDDGNGLCRGSSSSQRVDTQLAFIDAALDSAGACEEDGECTLSCGLQDPDCEPGKAAAAGCAVEGPAPAAPGALLALAALVVGLALLRRRDS